VTLNPWLTLLGGLVGLLVLMAFFLFRQVRISGSLRQTVGRLEEELRAARTELETSLATNREQQQFLDMLNSAEITTRLQKPRLILHPDQAPDIPEKYRYVSRMIADGMSREEISRILAVSPVEVDQLITLAGISASAGAGMAEERVKNRRQPVEE